MSVPLRIWAVRDCFVLWAMKQSSVLSAVDTTPNPEGATATWLIPIPGTNAAEWSKRCVTLVPELPLKTEEEQLAESSQRVEMIRGIQRLIVVTLDQGSISDRHCLLMVSDSGQGNRGERSSGCIYVLKKFVLAIQTVVLEA